MFSSSSSSSSHSWNALLSVVGLQDSDFHVVNLSMSSIVIERPSISSSSIFSNSIVGFIISSLIASPSSSIHLFQVLPSSSVLSTHISLLLSGLSLSSVSLNAVESSVFDFFVILTVASVFFFCALFSFIGSVSAGISLSRFHHLFIYSSIAGSNTSPTTFFHILLPCISSLALPYCSLLQSPSFNAFLIVHLNTFQGTLEADFSAFQGAAFIFQGKSLTVSTAFLNLAPAL
jgi:hypothetical protein